MAREAPGAALREPLEHRALALRIVVRGKPRFALGVGDLLGCAGPPIEQREDLLVDRIDLGAQVAELAHGADSTFASAPVIRQPSIAVANLSIHVARSGSFRISWYRPGKRRYCRSTLLTRSMNRSVALGR